jgi:hypothetical protein
MQAENHTAHVERIEPDVPSSAGWDTQRLALPMPAAPVEPASLQPVSGPQTAPRNNTVGIALIAIGVLIWLFRMLPDQDAVTGGLIMLTIASPFLFFAFWRRIYPLLIPGSILAGLSAGIPLAEATNGISIMWGLALAFVAIYFLGRDLFNVRSPWPLFPAVPLFIVGTIIGIASLPTFFAMGFVWIPLLLIAAGLYLGWGRRAP